jgi:SAM-dependent methyltransferase
MPEQIEKVRKSYETDFSCYVSGKNREIPGEILSLPGYKNIVEHTIEISVGSKDIYEYLKPKENMKFLDAGCGGDLAGYQLGDWPSLYYGVDISSVYISAMKMVAKAEKIKIGGLFQGEISSLSFEDNFFDTAACIGVTQYCTFEHLQGVISELARVLKPCGRMAIDIPNEDYPFFKSMIKLEEFLGRPNIIHRKKDFLELLERYFRVDGEDKRFCLRKFFVERLS